MWGSYRRYEGKCGLHLHRVKVQIDVFLFIYCIDFSIEFNRIGTGASSGLVGTMNDESCADSPFKGHGVHQISRLQLILSSRNPSLCPPGVTLRKPHVAGRVVLIFLDDIYC
jgi:hypothetical protein